MIYCSEVTRALLLLEHGPTLTKRLRALSIDQPHIIATGVADAVQEQTENAAAGRKRKAADAESFDGQNGFSAALSTSASAQSLSVTLLSSNHCPGTV